MNLGRVLAGYRNAVPLSVRDLAAQIGISHSTLSRIERGMPCDSGTLSKILLWLFAPNKETDNGA